MKVERLFSPVKTRLAIEERRRLWTLAARTMNEDDYDALSELDSELFDVVIAEDGSDDVEWRTKE